ncbi:MAG: hypothetical protein II208_04835 [Alphaproteobacteria bacterium]|nr:hypothetical protein [Alphaproteobacteria bacterium]
MKKKTLLFCNGISGSGKTYFIQKTLPAGLFYNLRSATTRPMRNGESEGVPYFFRDEAYFESEPLATHLWVNRAVWKPGDKKWLYGIPESEIYEHLGQNLIYDVIEPKYSRQLIDWFKKNGLDAQYSFRVAYFLPPINHMDTVISRANMPNDAKVRAYNTCDPADFSRAGLNIDYILRPIDGVYDPHLMAHIDMLQKQR